MKKLILSVLVAGMILSGQAEAKSLKALFNYCTFNAPGSGPYVETYLSVLGSSTIMKPNENGKLQGSIQISIEISKDEEIVYFDKYNLLSPEVTEGESTAFNFIDQQRIPIKNGNYTLLLSIKDNNNEEANAFKVEQPVVISYYSHIIAISDIQRIESYSQAAPESRIAKSGLDLVPYVNNYYAEDVEKLKFYAEVYHADKHLGENEKYLISYYIETFETKRVLDNFKNFKKEDAKSVSVVFAEFPLAELPSGNYNLVIEVRDRKNELLTMKQEFFMRNNAALTQQATENYLDIDVSNTFTAKYSDRDSLADYIRSLRPISNEREKVFEDNQLKIADVEMMQQFLYNFWLKRNDQQPEKAWNQYNARVQKAQELFGTRYNRGYDTERGRVFLQYGSPNSMEQYHHEPSAYPYEIWHYYKIGEFSNKRFVFFNPDLVTGDFQLLHSDMQGENFNHRWQIDLQRRNTQNRDFDKADKEDNFGNRSNINFQNP